MKWSTINFILGIIFQLAIYLVYHFVSFETAVIGGIALLVGITFNPPPRDKK